MNPQLYTNLSKPKYFIWLTIKFINSNYKVYTKCFLNVQDLFSFWIPMHPAMKIGKCLFCCHIMYFDDKYMGNEFS